MANNNIYGNMLSRPVQPIKPTQAYTRQLGQASGLGQKQPQTCPTGYRYDTVQGKCVAINKPATPTMGQQLGMPSTMTPQQPSMPSQTPATGTTTGQKQSPNEIWANVINNAINHLGNSIPSNIQMQSQQQTAPIGNQLALNPDLIRMVTGR
jgi:hypothetical protein